MLEDGDEDEDGTQLDVTLNAEEEGYAQYNVPSHWLCLDFQAVDKWPVHLPYFRIRYPVQRTSFPHRLFIYSITYPYELFETKNTSPASSDNHIRAREVESVPSLSR